jgi:hypothetical protein
VRAQVQRRLEITVEACETAITISIETARLMATGRSSIAMLAADLAVETPPPP